MKTTLLSVLCCCGFAVAYAQAPAVWNNVQTDQSVLGLVLDDSQTHLIIWGTGLDSCQEGTPSLLVIDTNGGLIRDTSYELEYCDAEGAWRFIPNSNGSGYYLITDEDGITPEDSSFVHYIDANFEIQWREYMGENIRSNVFNYGNRNYVSVDNSTNFRYVLRFYQPGLIDTLNQITLPYFTVAPQRIICADGLVFEFGQQLNNDSSFVCIVYDTLGNLFTSFSFDASFADNEVPQFISIHHNQIFHVTGGPFSPRTYPASSGITGINYWTDTLNYVTHPYFGACIDTLNNEGYVMCDTPNDVRLFSYDILTGSLIDSIALDSVRAIFSGIKSGPQGGVFLLYNKRYTDTTLLDQYDSHFNRIWQGYTVNPVCAVPCNPLDFVFDSTGAVYTVSSCSCSGASILTSKFTPSLVGLNEAIVENTVQLFPNPSSTYVTISVTRPDHRNQVQLFDPEGRLLFSDVFNQNTYTLVTTSLSSGIYFVNVITESGESSTQKLIIQHQ